MTLKLFHPRQQNRALNATAHAPANARVCRCARVPSWIAPLLVHVLERFRLFFPPPLLRGRGTAKRWRGRTGRRSAALGPLHLAALGTSPLTKGEERKTIILPKFRQLLARTNKSQVARFTALLRILRDAPRGYPPGVKRHSTNLSSPDFSPKRPQSNSPPVARRRSYLSCH